LNDINKDILAEFVTQIHKYLKHFGLIEADLGALIGTGSGDIKGILNFTKSVGLKRLGRIASIFGLTYYEFGNPLHPYPKFDDLPLETQIAITKRKEIGNPNRDYSKDLAGNLDKILSTDYLSMPRTAEEIWQQLPINVRETIGPTRVTDLLGKNPRNKMVTKVGKKGKEHLFQLKKVAEKE